MKSLLSLAAVAGFLLFLFAPRTAHARESSVPETFREWAATKPAQPVQKGPVEQPEDWIAVAGIVCYAVIPVVLVIGIGFVAFELWTRNSNASLVARDAWIYRGAAGGPPQGIVLLAF